MSKTPRTDDKLQWLEVRRQTKLPGEWDALELAHFARDLEQELRTCQERLSRSEGV